MAVIFSALFAAAALIHLLSIFLGKQGLRMGSKVCLLPLLFAVYLLRARNFSAFVALALFFGWAGDIFLITISRRAYFMAGLSCFLVGHFFYIASILGCTGAFTWPVLIISAVLAVPLEVFLIRFLKPDKAMRVPTIVYGVTLVCLVLASLQLFCFYQDRDSLMVLAGSFCFMFSDIILAGYTFGTLPRFGNAVVMFPYILAQTGLALGLGALPNI